MEPSARVYLKKLSFSIIVILRQTFLNTFIKIPILGKLYQCGNCYAKLNNIGSNIYVSSATLLSSVWLIKKSALSISARFLKNYLIVICCAFGRFEIQTLRPNGFKNQANDTLKLLGHNYSHLQELFKQENVALHHCGFQLKFPKHFYEDCCFG